MLFINKDKNSSSASAEVVFD